MFCAVNKTNTKNHYTNYTHNHIVFYRMHCFFSFILYKKSLCCGLFTIIIIINYSSAVALIMFIYANLTS